MKKIKITILKSVLFSIIAFYSSTGFSQIGLGTTTPTNQSLLDLRATDKGLLIPRLTSAEKTTLGSTLTTAADNNNKGMQVFDTDTNSNWFWNGTVWVQMLDVNSSSRKLATNIMSTSLQPYQIIYIDPVTSSYFSKNCALTLPTDFTTAANLGPIVGYVDSATPVSPQQEFYVQTFSRGQAIYGISGTFSINSEIWYRPYLTPQWSNTRDNQNPCLLFGIAKSNSSSATARTLSVDPKWFNISNIINTTYKPILDNSITDSANITAIGRYVVPANGLTNGFAGQANKYADYNGTSFTYTSPATGDKIFILGGVNLGVVYTYNGTTNTWDKNGQTTSIPTDNYVQANAYNAGDIVIRNNKIYQANASITAGTAFAIGTLTDWKKISEIPDWSLTGIYEVGDIVKKDGTLYEANGNITISTAFTIGTFGTTWKKINSAGTVPEWLDGGEMTITSTGTAPAKPTTRIDKIYYKQIGNKTWQVEGVLSWSSASGASTGSGDYLITLPNSLSFDNSILTQKNYTADVQVSTLRMFGKCISNSSVKAFGSSAAPYVNGIVPYDATKFRVFIGQDVSVGYYCWGSSWFALNSATMEIKFNFTFQSL